MSVKAVNGHIWKAMYDKELTTEETGTILSREDRWNKAPTSIGSFIDKDEFAAIADLRQRVLCGEIQASPEARSMLEEFVARGPDSRLKHTLKGGPITGKAVGAAVGVAAGVGNTLLTAAFMAEGGCALAGDLAIGTFASASAYGAAYGLAAGYLAGVVHGLLDD